MHRRLSLERPSPQACSPQLLPESRNPTLRNRGNSTASAKPGTAQAHPWTELPIADEKPKGAGCETDPLRTMLYRLKVRLAGRLVRPDLSRAFRVTV